MKLPRIFTLLLLFVAVQGLAQVPTPAKPQAEAIVLKGATIHVGNGQVIENGMVRFEKGKITYVGKLDVGQTNGAKVIEAAGKQVYPGLIAPNTILGLSEIDAVRATQDNSEVGELNANVRAIIAYNTDSKVTPTVRSNGILLAEITPNSGVISGSSSIVQLDAWNWEDAAYKTDFGIHMNWPSIYHRTGWWAEPGPIEINKNYDKSVDEIKEYFAQAQAYAKSNDADRPQNLRFEAMKGLFDKTKKLFIHVGNAREVMAIIDFNKTLNLDMVLVSDADILGVAPQLKENYIPVVLYNLHELPSHGFDDVYLPYKTPFLLKQAGVDFCLSLGGSWQQRNLPFIAGTAAAYGLTKEEALAAVTSNTARILGIDKNVGTLEPGKDATLIVSTGDLLDMKSSNVELAFINGRQIDLNNMQKDLYHKFESKYQDQK